ADQELARAGAARAARLSGDVAMNPAVLLEQPPSTRGEPELVSEQQELFESWRNPYTGVVGFFSDVSHRTIGLRFVMTALVFFLLGGLEALAMRMQLARPEQTLLSADLYNQVFTTHGSTMMFL